MLFVLDLVRNETVATSFLDESWLSNLILKLTAWAASDKAACSTATLDQPHSLPQPRRNHVDISPSLVILIAFPSIFTILVIVHIKFFITMFEYSLSTGKPYPPRIMSGERNFFTFFPREIRDEIYSQVLADVPLTLNVPPPSTTTTATLPFLASKLPHCLTSSRKMAGEAISAYLRRTTIVVAHLKHLETAMAGLNEEAWQSVRYLSIESGAKNEDVKHILSRCPGLRSLTLEVLGSMVLPPPTAVSTTCPSTHASQHRTLRELNLICIDGNNYNHDSDRGSGLKDAFQAWAEKFVEEGKKRIEVKVKIIPYKGFKRPRYEFDWYTDGCVTAYQYQCWFG
jgi:hypothetical protein